MEKDITKATDEELQSILSEWSEQLLRKERPDPGNHDDVSTAMMYGSLIQTLNGELTGRYVRETTGLALRIAGTSLVVAIVAFLVSATR